MNYRTPVACGYHNKNLGWYAVTLTPARVYAAEDRVLLVPAPPPRTEVSILTDDEIAAAFLGTNFGHTNYRELLESSVLKKMMGYHCGHTITTIMQQLRLIGKREKPTVRGRKLVREAYAHLTVMSG